MPVTARLSSSFVEGPSAGLEYRLVFPDGEGNVTIKEQLRPAVVDGNVGYKRQFVMRSDRQRLLYLELDHADQNAKTLHGRPDNIAKSRPTPSSSLSKDHMLVRRDGNGDTVVWRLSERCRLVSGGDTSLTLEIEMEAGRPVGFDVTAWPVKEWTPDLLDLLKRSR